MKNEGIRKNMDNLTEMNMWMQEMDKEQCQAFRRLTDGQLSARKWHWPKYEANTKICMLTEDEFYWGRILAIDTTRKLKTIWRRFSMIAIILFGCDSNSSPMKTIKHKTTYLLGVNHCRVQKRQPCLQLPISNNNPEVEEALNVNNHSGRWWWED